MWTLPQSPTCHVLPVVVLTPGVPSPLEHLGHPPPRGSCGIQVKCLLWRKTPRWWWGGGRGAGEAWREDTIPLCFIHFCSGWLFPRKHVLGDFQHQQISYRRLCLAAGPPLHRPVWGLPPWTHQSSIPACPSVSHGTGINEFHLCLHLLRASHQKPHLAHL